MKKNVIVLTVVLLGLAITLTRHYFLDKKEEVKYRPFRVQMTSGFAVTTVDCDSLNMISPTTVDIWVDGTRMRVYSRSQILISQNEP